MGSFYVNHTVRCVDTSAIAKIMSGRSAFVTKPSKGCTVVFDEESDSQNPDVVFGLGAKLSENLKCPVLAVLNYDDDILIYAFFDNGQVVDQYNSEPNYFAPDAEPAGPAGGDAARLASAFNSSNGAEVDRVLRRSSYDEDGYAFDFERHRDLAAALKLPESSVNMGFGYLSRGDLPQGTSLDDFVKVG